MLEDVGFYEAVALALGAFCILIAAILVLKGKGKEGSGSIDLPGIKLSGKGAAVLFLLVGAVLILSARKLRTTRVELATTNQDLVHANAVKAEALRAVEGFTTTIKARDDYIGALEARVPPQMMEELRTIRPQILGGELALSPLLREEMLRLEPPNR